MLNLLPRRRHWAYVALAVGTVALAVGVNLVVFTIVNALWLRRLPVRDADRLVYCAGPNCRFADGEDRPFDPENRIFRPFQGAVAGQVDESQFGLTPILT